MFVKIECRQQISLQIFHTTSLKYGIWRELGLIYGTFSILNFCITERLYNASLRELYILSLRRCPLNKRDV